MHFLRLYINIDHIATIREARKTTEPDPVVAARAAEDAGAHGITAHLREDRRHIQDNDIVRLASDIRTVLNFELATSPEIVQLATRVRPYQATLVPERREEVTTEGGLNLKADPARLTDAINQLAGARCRVSLFIDPDLSVIDHAKRLGVPAIELHTGRYAHAWPSANVELAELRRAAEHAAKLGLAVHAGHGLTYDNVAPVAAIPEIEELNIGHSIVSRAVMDGMYRAVSEMLRAVHAARRVDRR